MPHRTWGQVKTFVAESLHEEETDTILSTNLLPRWGTQVLDRIRRYAYWRWDEDSITLTWPGTANATDGSILYLPSFIYRVMTLVPASAQSRRTVEIIHAWEFDRLFPGSRLNRGQDYLVIHGYYGVEADNPTEGVLTVAPSAAGTGNQDVIIEGLDPNNREIKETVQVTAGGASDTTTNTFKSGVGGVRNIFLSGTATGTVITVSSGGTTLERLDSSREVAHEHLRTEMYANLSGGGSFEVRFWRRLLSETPTDSDIIPIPFEFHELLEIGMMERLQRFRGNVQEAALLESAFQGTMREFLAWDRRDPGRKRQFRTNRQWPGVGFRR